MSNGKCLITANALRRMHDRQKLKQLFQDHKLNDYIWN